MKMLIKVYKFSLEKWNMQFEYLRSSGKYDPHIHYYPLREIKYELCFIQNCFNEYLEKYLDIDIRISRYPNDPERWLKISKMWFDRLSSEYNMKKYIERTEFVNKTFRTNFNFEDFLDETYIEIIEPEELCNIS